MTSLVLNNRALIEKYFSPSHWVLFMKKMDIVCHDHMLITVNSLCFKENNLKPNKKINYIPGLARMISML